MQLILMASSMLESDRNGRHVRQRVTAGAYTHRVCMSAAALAFCTSQGGAVQLEAKHAGGILLGRPLRPYGRVSHQQQVRKCCAKKGAVHIALIRPCMSQVLGCRHVAGHTIRWPDTARFSWHDKSFGQVAEQTHSTPGVTWYLERG